MLYQGRNQGDEATDSYRPLLQPQRGVTMGLYRRMRNLAALPYAAQSCSCIGFLEQGQQP